MSPLINLFALAFLGSVAGLIGGVVFLFKKKWAETLTVHAIPLAAGVLLAVSLLDLLPEAVNVIGKQAFSIILLVFVAAFLIERFLFYLHHHREPDESHIETAVPAVILGDTIHNFLDGVAIAAAFVVEPSLGLVVALATFLHETPHEIADFGILLSAGWTRRKAFTANLFSALATFPGAAFTFFYAKRVESATGILLAVAAGLFLYVAATDFLPEVGHASKAKPWLQAVLLIAGILAIVALGILVPEMGSTP